MRVFVTGASGFVGSAVVKDLIGAGHQVLGLARSDSSAASVAAAGANVHRGSLEDLESLRSGVGLADAVIHTAFIHDFSKFAENGQVDRRAIVAMGDALAGTNRPFIVTSGTALVSPGQLATEDIAAPSGHALPRVSEQAGLAYAARAVRAMAVRLPPSVHGNSEEQGRVTWKGGLVPLLIDVARQKGVSAYIGDGSNRWPAVHRLDAAPVYRLMLEKGVAGACYHPVAEEGVPLRDIAAAIGRGLDLPVVSIKPEEAPEHFGFVAIFAGVDAPASSDRTRERRGWRSSQPGLISDMNQANLVA